MPDQEKDEDDDVTKTGRDKFGIPLQKKRGGSQDGRALGGLKIIDKNVNQEIKDPEDQDCSQNDGSEKNDTSQKGSDEEK